MASLGPKLMKRRSFRRLCALYSAGVPRVLTPRGQLTAPTGHQNFRPRSPLLQRSMKPSFPGRCSIGCGRARYDAAILAVAEYGKLLNRPSVWPGLRPAPVVDASTETTSCSTYLYTNAERWLRLFLRLAVGRTTPPSGSILVQRAFWI